MADTKIHMIPHYFKSKIESVHKDFLKGIENDLLAIMKKEPALRDVIKEIKVGFDITLHLKKKCQKKNNQ